MLLQSKLLLEFDELQPSGKMTYMKQKNQFFAVLSTLRYAQKESPRGVL